jgi:hypothetical protein
MKETLFYYFYFNFVDIASGALWIYILILFREPSERERRKAMSEERREGGAKKKILVYIAWRCKVQENKRSKKAKSLCDPGIPKKWFFYRRKYPFFTKRKMC